MTDTAFDWRCFLERWSEEWADTCEPEDGLGAGEDAARRTRRLGFEPASPARIEAMEERLGARMPPSYREFLAITDGWRNAGCFVSLLGGTDGARWYVDDVGFAELYEEEAREYPTPEMVSMAGMWSRALQLEVESDATYVLLDPGDVDEHGEWALYCYRAWGGEIPQRYASFREFMLAMYREFHSLSAGRHAERAFVNATTRELDADLERARECALAGDWERAEAEFARIAEYGRPGARVLGDQLRRFQGHTHLVEFGLIAFDPGYAWEFRPALADVRVRNGHGDSLGFTRVGWTSDEAMAAAEEVLRQVRESTFRYTAPGAFGRVVDAAWEQARWGATDRAWRILETGLHLWEPLGPDHIAPVGLFADSVLGPLLTPERGRLLLATPRGGQRGGAAARGSEPGSGAESVLDPDGLTWLAEPDHNGTCQAYRFILVQGAEPAELASLIGADGHREPSPPRTRWEAERAAWTGTSSSYDDKALVAIGRAGPDWAFAFDARPQPFHEARFVSPVGAASRPGRAVVVWCAPDQPGSPRGLFHLSVAEGGVECHAFTLQGATVRRSGDAPPALDPDRLFPPDAGELFSPSGHRRALAAVAAEFGVGLPRFALTRGRLHTLTTDSWTRPPGAGEGYLTITISPERDCDPM